MAMFERSKILREPYSLTPDISVNELRYVGNDIRVFIGQPASSVDGCVTCESFFANNLKAGDVYKSAIHELHLRCKWPIAGNNIAAGSDIKRLLRAIARESKEYPKTIATGDEYNQPLTIAERVREQGPNLDPEGAEEVRKSPVPILVAEDNEKSVESLNTNGGPQYGFDKHPTTQASSARPSWSEEGLSPTSYYFGEDLFTGPDFRPGRAITKKVRVENGSPAPNRDISTKSEPTAIGTERQREKGYLRLPSRLQYPSGHKSPLSSPIPFGLPSPLTPNRLSPALVQLPVGSVPLGSPIGYDTSVEWKPLVSATRGEDITSDPFLGITITPPPTIKSADLLWPTRANKPVRSSTPGPNKYPFSRIPYPFGKFGFRPNEQPKVPLNDFLSADDFKVVENLLIPSPDGLPRQECNSP